MTTYQTHLLIAFTGASIGLLIVLPWHNVLTVMGAFLLFELVIPERRRRLLGDED